MDAKTSIEITRTLLHNAIEMNMNKEIVFKISQRMDQYIVEYYVKYGGLKGGTEEEKNQ